MVRPTINSTKRILQITPTTVTIGNRDLILIAVAKQNPDDGEPSDVAVGTNIKAVYCELWQQTTDNQPGSQNTIFAKGTNNTRISALEQGKLHDFGQKNNIFYTTQGLIGDANSNPIPVMRDWKKVPKGKQRMALGDSLYISVLSITNNVNFCGQFTFKAYT